MYWWLHGHHSEELWCNVYRGAKHRGRYCSSIPRNDDHAITNTSHKRGWQPHCYTENDCPQLYEMKQNEGVNDHCTPQNEVVNGLTQLLNCQWNSSSIDGCQGWNISHHSPISTKSIRFIILIMRFMRLCMFMCMILMIDISALDNRQCHWNSTGNWVTE